MSTAPSITEDLVGRRVRAISIPAIFENGVSLGYTIESMETIVSRIDAEKNVHGPFRYKRESDSQWQDTSWYFTEFEVLELEATDIQIKDLQDEVTNLTAQLEAQREALNTTQRRVNELEDKPQLVTTAIGEHLIQVATNHGYCSTYDDEVDSLNDLMSRRYGVTLPLRQRLMEHQVAIVGTVRTYVTVWVNDGDDISDPDNWLDSDGDGIDGYELITDQLTNEVENNGFDDTGVRD